MRLGLLVHWLRGRPLLTGTVLLLTVSGLFVIFSDTRTAGRFLSHGARVHPIRHSDHVTDDNKTTKGKVVGHSSSGDVSNNDGDVSKFGGDVSKFTSKGGVEREEAVGGVKESDVRSSMSKKPQSRTENKTSSDGDYDYRDYKNKITQNGIIEDDVIYTLVQESKSQNARSRHPWAGKPVGLLIPRSVDYFPKSALVEIYKYLDKGDIDPSDALFAPCEGPNIPEVKPQPIYGFLGPFRYLANYKNPCWMEFRADDDPVVHCVPYFYLVGAPKAGSTDLFKRIVQHPEVVPPTSKETRWFDRARFSNKPMFSSFLANFKDASNIIARTLDRGSNYHRLVTGDGSPSYFFDNRLWPFIPGNEGCTEPRITVASHIKHLYPKAKIIFILRNPVDRLYSSYLYNHAKYEFVSSKAFDQLVREAVTLYKDCFARYSVRQCANNATVFSQSKVMLIVSLYSVFVRDWLELFPKEQILVMTTEKYNANMEEHLAKIFDFLELSPLNHTELAVIARHGPYNKGNHYGQAGPMLPSTKYLLEEFYRPYNQELAHLLNSPDFLWRY